VLIVCAFRQSVKFICRLNCRCIWGFWICWNCRNSSWKTGPTKSRPEQSGRNRPDAARSLA